MLRSFAPALLWIAAAACAGCGGGSGGASTPKTAPSAAATATATPSPGATAAASTPYTCPSAPTSSGTLNCSSLPLGDLKYSTLAALQNSVYLCSTPGGGGGPVVSSAPWLNTAAGTWHLTKKVAVQGAVAWPGAFSSTVSSDGTTRSVSSNGLPLSPYTTGTFPIASTDPAYAYDHNPNHIAAQSFSYTLPARPSPAASPSCLPAGGPIAITTTGVAIYNAFDAAGYDGVAHEVQDSCHGHPDPTSTYHYHGFIQTCSGDTGSPLQNSSLVGYALDGFGIYGPWYNGKLLTSADLDVCHGTSSAVMWNGALTTIYHYVSTYDFPYTLGCYRGTPVRA
jgi:hypothetical protein